jgi:hypothetical protein
MSQIHAKTDKLSLVAVPQPDGKMRVTRLSWDEPLVILPGQLLECSWQENGSLRVDFAD